MRVAIIRLMTCRYKLFIQISRAISTGNVNASKGAQGNKSLANGIFRFVPVFELNYFFTHGSIPLFQ